MTTPEGGTLYVAGVPAGHPADITRRALAVLEGVDLVIADDTRHAQWLLSRHGIDTPLGTSTDIEGTLAALSTGNVALLSPGWTPGPSASDCLLVRKAVERGFTIAAVPGPTLPITALIVSGLPADSFVYLGDLPQESHARHELLASLSHERHTLIVRVAWDLLPEYLADLRATLGDRNLALLATDGPITRELWRGTASEIPDRILGQGSNGPCVLVVGGAAAQTARWDKDRLIAHIQAQLEQGLGTKEVSRQIAVESGWPRREIYRLAVEIARLSAGD
jgi:16S rRNA (cytidine1402-2'-O)-methyltransferase